MTRIVLFGRTVAILPILPIISAASLSAVPAPGRLEAAAALRLAARWRPSRAPAAISPPIPSNEPR